MVWSSVLIGFAVGGAIAYTVGFRQGRRHPLRTPVSPVPLEYIPAPPVPSSPPPPVAPQPNPSPGAIAAAPPSLVPTPGTGEEEGAAPQNELSAWQLANYRAVQTEQFKSGFLARTAHELRSPLSSTVGLHQLILSDLCENREEEREFIQQANDAVLKWVDLLDHLIDVSKVTYGNVSVNLQTISVEKLFTEVTRLVELQAANRNLKLTVMIPEETCLGIGDPKRLCQVLVDLAEAVIAMLTERGQGGALQFSASQSKTQLLINLDSSCPLDLWQEAVELLEGPDPLATVTAPTVTRDELLGAIEPIPFTSPTLALRLAHLLLQSMGGSLVTRDLSAEGVASDRLLTSRFEIALPTNLA